ncbi:MAG: DNA-protecting protein DprA [Alphaproteobacteria bacterium]|nr:DNA-protecting protein DprA [Alphaproteobacteria bacterium]
MPLAGVLRLVRTPNVGPVTFFQLIRRYGSADAALERLPELSLRGGRARPLTPSSIFDAQKELDAAARFGARMIVYGGAEYPSLLHMIPDPPPLLTVTGDAALWTKRTVAMVGARNASANACALAQKLARELGAEGITVVSGLARGIDAFAHKGALATGTVGVIAGGIDTVYPPENAELYAQLRERGAIITEQPFLQSPFAGAFPSRNRIIAGMSLATLVVEASPKSGSLITARLALEQGREVLAVPGSPLDPRARGCNRLLKDGAVLVEEAADVIEALGQARPIGTEDHPPASYTLPPPRSVSEAELAEARKLLLARLSHVPTPVDMLVAQCSLPPGVALTVLLELELAGRLQRQPGNRVCLTSGA